MGEDNLITGDEQGRCDEELVYIAENAFHSF